VNGLALALGVALAAAAVVLVALPFLREPVADDDRLDAPTAGESHHLGLIEERDRALAALKELEFDQRTGKVSDEDYRALLGPLRRQAAAALRAIDREPRYGSEMSFEPPETAPEPAPAPDEGTLPAPAIVPEPSPPPDEATPPIQPQIPEPGPQE
jgi:hypothetical protein